MPYHSQWVSRELIGDIINGRISADADPLWMLSGANSPEEYEFWAKNICGMACLKMILDYLSIESPSIIALAKECVDYGAYKLKNESVDGLFYAPFTDYLKERFNLEAYSLSPLSTDEISTETLNGNIFIVSVHYSIRKPSILYEGEKGGHLVVVSGVDVSKNSFFINNPSGHNITTQQNYEINFKLFEKYFAGRGILIKRSFVT